MAPLIVRARSSTVGPSDGDGASLSSSSEVVSPLIVLASIQTFEPRRMPTSTSPDADCISTLPLAAD